MAQCSAARADEAGHKQPAALSCIAQHQPFPSSARSPPRPPRARPCRRLHSPPVPQPQEKTPTSTARERRGRCAAIRQPRTGPSPAHLDAALHLGHRRRPPCRYTNRPATPPGPLQAYNTRISLHQYNHTYVRLDAGVPMVLSPEERIRLNEQDDSEFYRQPRFVAHTDEAYTRSLTALYRSTLRPGSTVLDLMSSWQSHLPMDIQYESVLGIGKHRTYAWAICMGMFVVMSDAHSSMQAINVYAACSVLRCAWQPHGDMHVSMHEVVCSVPSSDCRHERG